MRSKWAWLLVAILLLAVPRMALAHGDLGHFEMGPGEIWQHWNWRPLELLTLGLPAAIYALGVGRLWRRLDVGHGVSVMQVTAFSAGMLALFIALISPVDALGEALFSGHMFQHLLLLIAAPLLLVLAHPSAVLMWGLPQRWRAPLGQLGHLKWLRGAWRISTLPLLIWSLHTLAMWVWHLPQLYQAALLNDLIHAAEHASFFGTGLLYWWSVLRPAERSVAGYGVSVLSLFATMMQSGILGLLITFSQEPWYPAHAAGAYAWGISLLEDQQLAGLIMWIPAGTAYLLAAIYSLMLWFNLMEAAAPHRAQLKGSE